MSTSKYLLSGLLILAASSGVGNAQDADPAAEQSYYHVELVVFGNRDQSRTTAEIPQIQEAEIGDILDQDLARADTSYVRPMEDEVPDLSAQDWQPTPAAKYLLSGTANSLQRLGAYELLAHLSWEQPAPDVSEALEVDLALLGVNPAVLSGNVNFYQQRYLHLALDLQLKDGVLNSAIGSEPLAAVPAITESRRIRLEELHYYDQPSFGVIAMVARVEPAKSD